MVTENVIYLNKMFKVDMTDFLCLGTKLIIQKKEKS